MQLKALTVIPLFIKQCGIIVISIIYFLLLLINYFIHQIFRQILKIALFISVRKYARLLTVEEHSWAVEKDVSKNLITVVYVIKYHHEQLSCHETIKKRISDKFFTNPHKNYLKLNATRRQFMGYQYLVKNDLTVDDIVKKMDANVEDEEGFKRYLSDITNSPLPKDNTALWDCFVPTKPIIWHNNPEIKHVYPLVFRVHHIVGDAFSLTNVLMHTLCDERFKSVDILNNPETSQKNTPTFMQKFMMSLKNGAFLFWVILNCWEITGRQLKFRTTAKNSVVFDAKTFTGKKIIYFKTEENEELVPLCREMRRKLGHNPKFVHIVFAAVSRSLSTYFQKKMQNVPDHILGYITMLLKIPKQTKSVLKNNFAAVQAKLPTDPKYSMTKSVAMFHNAKETRKLLEDMQWNYLTLQYGGVFPMPVLNYVGDLFQIPVEVTNLPLPQKLEMLNGCEVIDVIGLPPNWIHCGITISCISYNNRFQISLLVDTSIISKEEEAREIVNDIFKNFRVLNDELNISPV